MQLAGNVVDFDVGQSHSCAILVRLIDSCITQLKAQGPSRTCNESKEEEEEEEDSGKRGEEGWRAARSEHGFGTKIDRASGGEGWLDGCEGSGCQGWLYPRASCD